MAIVNEVIVAPALALIGDRRAGRCADHRADRRAADVAADRAADDRAADAADQRAAKHVLRLGVLHRRGERQRQGQSGSNFTDHDLSPFS